MEVGVGVGVAPAGVVHAPVVVLQVWPVGHPHVGLPALPPQLFTTVPPVAGQYPGLVVEQVLAAVPSVQVIAVGVHTPKVLNTEALVFDDSPLELNAVTVQLFVVLGGKLVQAKEVDVRLSATRIQLPAFCLYTR